MGWDDGMVEKRREEKREERQNIKDSLMCLYNYICCVDVKRSWRGGSVLRRIIYYYYYYFIT